MDKIQYVDHFKARIREAAKQATRDTLQRVWQKVECRLDTCRVSDGAHAETYELRSVLFGVRFKIK
jgi:hypothetical protein